MKKPVSFNCELSNLVWTSLDGQIVYGQVYAGDYESGSEDFFYLSHFDGGYTKDQKEARCYFHFSYRWRGVWEGRIYFKDDEYWSDEIAEMAALWTLIEAHCKTVIQAAFPGDHYDD